MPALERLKSQLTRRRQCCGPLRQYGPGAPVSSEENPAIIFDRAAEKVCRGCALCELCWQKEYTGTFNALNDATPYLLERGRSCPRTFPGISRTGASICRTFHGGERGADGDFCSGASTGGGWRRAAGRPGASTPSSASSPPPPPGWATGRCRGRCLPTGWERPCGPRRGRAPAGDTVVSFETETGLLCLLLADGMGCGEAARKESTLACRLVRQFLEAGIEPEAALKTLNAAMSLRSAETGSFTTIDLLTCRPRIPARAAFYKSSGGAQLSEKGAMSGGSPAGRCLRDFEALRRRRRDRVTLAPGSFAVLISDGVADPSRDEWLQDLLAGWGGGPQVLAGLILKESIQREALADDCGIQVLYLPREGR